MNRPHTSSDAETLRRRANRLRHDAEDQQPWRCVACGEAVSMIRHNHCACTRKLMATTLYGIMLTEDGSPTGALTDWVRATS